MTKKFGSNRQTIDHSSFGSNENRAESIASKMALLPLEGSDVTQTIFTIIIRLSRATRIAFWAFVPGVFYSSWSSPEPSTTMTVYWSYWLKLGDLYTNGIAFWMPLNCCSRNFGLIHVDYAQGSLNRTLKDSAAFFQRMMEERSVPFVQPPGRSGCAALASPLLLFTLATCAIWTINWVRTGNALCCNLTQRALGENSFLNTRT